MAKFVYMAMLGILCINMSIYLVNEYSLMDEVEYMTPVFPQNITDNVDFNGTITPDPNLVNTQGYDIYGGIGKFYRLTRTLVLGVPDLMAEVGAPGPIILVVDAIYTFMWGVFYLEMVLGRDIGE